jgi:hypothetical protein
MLVVVLNRTSNIALCCSSVAILTLGMITVCDGIDATCNSTTVSFIGEVRDLPINAVADLMNVILYSDA